MRQVTPIREKPLRGRLAWKTSAASQSEPVRAPAVVVEMEPQES
jgi:hypothetical protein